MIAKIFQRLRSDCGVACAAMLLGKPYEDTLLLFIAAGLDKRVGRHLPFCSKVGELQKVLEADGAIIKRQRFTDWDSLKTPCIAKTLVRPNGDWHWVVIDRDPELGIYVLDPCEVLPCYEYIPELGASVTIDYYIPQGTCLHISS
jgi:hypothetical protein